MADAKPKSRNKLRPEDPAYVEQVSEAFPFIGYIEGEEYRGITYQQLDRIITYTLDNCTAWRDLSSLSSTAGQTLSSDILNLHHINDWLVLPATRQHNCSCVELLTSEKQKPNWFISHWWGEKAVDLLECIGAYMEVRHLRANAAFWVCAYAIRQHSPDLDISADPRVMSFYKAMKLSQGVLLILDGEAEGTGRTVSATPFTRLWCTFELSMAILHAHKPIDIAACNDGEVSILTHGLTHDEEGLDTKNPGWGRRNKVKRESSFPVGILKKSLDISVENGDTSLETDRMRLLSCIAGYGHMDTRVPIESRAYTPPKAHANYTKVNVELRAHFAVAMWVNAVESVWADMELLASTLLADRWRTSLAMNFDLSTKMDDAQLLFLSQGISKHLLTLELHLGMCESISNKGIEVLSKALPDKLDTLVLSFQRCFNLSSPSVTSVGRQLESLRSLKVLRLNFESDRLILSVHGLTEGLANVSHLSVLDLNLGFLDQLSNKEVIALAKAVPQKLKNLSISFQLCARLDNTAVAILAERLPSSLTALNLNFKGCDLITHAGVGALTQHLPQGLLALHINLEDCPEISEPAIASLVSALPLMLYGAKLNLQGTALSTEKQTICRRLDRMRAWMPHVKACTDSQVHKEVSTSTAAWETLLLRSINTIVVAGSGPSGHLSTIGAGEVLTASAGSLPQPRNSSCIKRANSAFALCPGPRGSPTGGGRRGSAPHVALGPRPQSSPSSPIRRSESSNESEEKALAGTLHRYFHHRTSTIGWAHEKKPLEPLICRPLQPPPSMCIPNSPTAMFMRPRTLFRGLSEPVWR